LQPFERRPEGGNPRNCNWPLSAGGCRRINQEKNPDACRGRKKKKKKKHKKKKKKKMAGAIAECCKEGTKDVEKRKRERGVGAASVETSRDVGS